MTDQQKIKKMLGILAGKRAGLEVMVEENEEERDAVLTPEMQVVLAEIGRRFADKSAGLRKDIFEMEMEIKQATLAFGESVKGGSLLAVWSKGRVSWDDKGLVGFAIAHPEINRFRKVGKSSASIRRAT